MDITKKMILAQLQENTGRALCDSGGAYGRHWERNQGKTWDDLAFGEKLEAYVYTHGERPQLELCLVVSLASYMENNLTYNANLQEEYDVFCEGKDEYAMRLMESFAATQGNMSPISYTYNDDNCLSQDIQYITFEYGGEECALVQSHNGCDARSGLGSPKAYNLRGDHYLGDCTCNSYGCKDKQWDEDGRAEDDSNLFELPVHQFVFDNKLEQQLKNLEQTDHNTPEVRKLMTEANATVELLQFNEFCDALTEPSVVVKDHKAYYVDAEPQEIYGSSYSLMG